MSRAMHENALLARIAALCAPARAGVRLGVGDDCAWVELAGRDALLAVDPVIEGVHFASGTPWKKVGEKALKRNLSDLAAMAAKPVACLLQLTVPRGMPEDDAFAVVQGVHEAGLAYGCILVGGDVSAGPAGCPLIASVSVVGEPCGGVAPILRSTARAGDALYVTGALGGSLETCEGRIHHIDFIPRLEVARLLAQNPATRPTAMMDLSDGLAQDLPRLAAHAVIDLPCLPIAAAARQAAKKSGKPAWRHAVADGEDYELLLAAAPGQVLPAQVAGVVLTRIGTVAAAGGLRLMADAHTCLPFAGLGWEHRA